MEAFTRTYLRAWIAEDDRSIRDGGPAVALLVGGLAAAFLEQSGGAELLLAEAQRVLGQRYVAKIDLALVDATGEDRITASAQWSWAPPEV